MRRLSRGLHVRVPNPDSSFAVLPYEGKCYLCSSDFPESPIQRQNRLKVQPLYSRRLRWAITSTVLSFINLDKAACINVSFSTSRLAVASSRRIRIIGEFLRKARAIEIRCLSPPDSSQPFSPIMLL